MLRHLGAAGAVEQLEPALDRVGLALCLHGPRIGGIDRHEAAAVVAAPDRQRQGIDQAAERLGLARQAFVALGELRELAPHPARVAQPQHRAPADGAPFGLDRAPGRAW